MLLSSSTAYVSFYFVLEVLAEGATIRKSLKELKKNLIVSKDNVSSRESLDGSVSSKENLDGSQESLTYPSNSSNSFSFVLKLWTVYAFLALWARHVEPLLLMIPGTFIWLTGYNVLKSLLVIALAFPQCMLCELLYDQCITRMIQRIDKSQPRCVFARTY